MLSPGPQRADGWQKGTVTATSPFTVELEDGTSVPGMPRLRGCMAGVGDIVVIRKIGGDRLVVDALDRNGPPLTKIGSRLVSQVVSNATNTTCAFGVTDVGVDSHGWADPANNRIVPTIAGWYHVAGYCNVASSAPIQTRLIFNLLVGSTRLAGTDMVSGGSGTPDVSASEVVYCDGTTADAITGSMFQSSGVSRALFWSLSVTLVRPGLS